MFKNPRTLLFACMLGIAFAFGTLSCTTITKANPVDKRVRNNGAVSADWSPDGGRLAIANNDRIRTYDATSLQQQQDLSSREKTAAGYRYDRRYGFNNTLKFINERLLVSTGMGGMLSIWDVVDGRRVELIDWPKSKGYPQTLDWDPVNGVLAAGTGLGSVMLVKLGSGQAPVELTGHEGGVFALRFGNDSNFLGAAGTGPEMVIWNLSTGQEFARIPVRGFIWGIEPFEFAEEFLVAGDRLEIWRFTGQQEDSDAQNPSVAGQVAGTTIVAGGLLLALYSIPLIGPAITGPVLSNPLMFTPVPTAGEFGACKRVVALTPDGTLLADMHPGFSSEKIRLLEPRSGNILAKLNPKGGGTCDLVFSLDGKRLLVANEKGGHIYDLHTETWTQLKYSIKD